MQDSILHRAFDPGDVVAITALCDQRRSIAERADLRDGRAEDGAEGIAGPVVVTVDSHKIHPGCARPRKGLTPWQDE